ncbi:MAG: hypothetical protein JNL42_23050 [Anaerolineae bacterium]|nr:hypothetical protein [Anaerolineae bacterium]
MDQLEAAVLRTLLYADVFGFPLTQREIHHFLIADQPFSEMQISRALESPALRPLLEFHDGYVMRAGRGDLAALRREREAAAAALWTQSIRYGAWLSRLPFVRMVAVTGALAMRNPSDHDDDLDYVLVTAAGRVWLARLFAIAVVRLSRLRGVTVCPNYVLAETALAQERRDLFIAHEVTQMVPVFGRDLYERMRTLNPWVASLMPNAQDAFYDETQCAPDTLWRAVKRLAEGLLGGALGDRLEAWEYRRKVARFSPQLRQPNSAARLDEERVKGHFNDHGHPVLQRYHLLLHQYGLTAENSTLPLAGD